MTQLENLRSDVVTKCPDVRLQTQTRSRPEEDWHTRNEHKQNRTTQNKHRITNTETHPQHTASVKLKQSQKHRNTAHSFRSPGICSHPPRRGHWCLRPSRWIGGPPPPHRRTWERRANGSVSATVRRSTGCHSFKHPLTPLKLLLCHILIKLYHVIINDLRLFKRV